MTVTEHDALAVIKWLRACRTKKQLAKLWTDELTNYSKELPGVVAAKDRLKGKLK
jgi:hypothetical protein